MWTKYIFLCAPKCQKIYNVCDFCDREYATRRWVNELSILCVNIWMNKKMLYITYYILLMPCIHSLISVYVRVYSIVYLRYIRVYSIQYMQISHQAHEIENKNQKKILLNRCFVQHFLDLCLLWPSTLGCFCAVIMFTLHFAMCMSIHCFVTPKW